MIYDNHVSCDLGLPFFDIFRTEWFTQETQYRDIDSTVDCWEFLSHNKVSEPQTDAVQNKLNIPTCVKLASELILIGLEVWWLVLDDDLSLWLIPIYFCWESWMRKSCVKPFILRYQILFLASVNHLYRIFNRSVLLDLPQNRVGEQNQQ